MNPKWSSKFELKPGNGKWVFVPTTEARTQGKVIKAMIERRWKPPAYFYHLRSGGHVEAIRSHLQHTTFLHLDIENFFGSINKTRITRCLKSKFGYETSREWANASTVPHPNDRKRSIVPFGFVQSQIIAAICFHESALGKKLDKLSKLTDVSISVYVDDIIVSSGSAKLCVSVFDDLIVAAARSHFTLNTDKQEDPADAITAFNIVLANDSMRIDDHRLALFAQELKDATTDYQREGILSYVASVNVDQRTELAR